MRKRIDETTNTQHLQINYNNNNNSNNNNIRQQHPTIMSINKEGVAAGRLCAALAVAFVWLAMSAEAHVALTYPPARALDLDFLDNARTKAPCGMPKGKIYFTLFYFQSPARFG